jgi:hypothetical protein
MIKVDDLREESDDSLREMDKTSMRGRPLERGKAKDVFVT